MNSLVVLLSVMACVAAQSSGGLTSSEITYRAPASIATPGVVPDATADPTAVPPGTPKKPLYLTHLVGKRSAPLIATAPVISTYSAAAPVVSTYAASPIISTYAAAPVAYTAHIARVPAPVLTSAYGVHPW